MFFLLFALFLLENKTPVYRRETIRKQRTVRPDNIKEYSLEKEENGFVLLTILTKSLLQYCLSYTAHILYKTLIMWKDSKCKLKKNKNET